MVGGGRTGEERRPGLPEGGRYRPQRRKWVLGAPSRPLRPLPSPEGHLPERTTGLAWKQKAKAHQGLAAPEMVERIRGRWMGAGIFCSQLY